MAQPVTEILDHCGPLLSRYSALICDAWGVLHNGVKAYPDSVDALQRYRKQGGIVVILSNSPQPSSGTVAVFEAKGVPRDVYDQVITSGDLTEATLGERELKKVFWIGPERHGTLFARKSYASVPMEEAQAIVCTGFYEDGHAAEDYAPLLKRALKHGLELYCANPDFVVDIGGTLYPCAGAIAALYEKMDGVVHWAGKPYANAYRAALKAIAGLCRKSVSAGDILVIGDALATDIAGAARSGLDALFLAQGIHREEIAPRGKLEPEAVQALFTAHKLKARAAAFSLNW